MKHKRFSSTGKTDLSTSSSSSNRDVLDVDNCASPMLARQRTRLSSSSVAFSLPFQLVFVLANIFFLFSLRSLQICLDDISTKRTHQSTTAIIDISRYIERNKTDGNCHVCRWQPACTCFSRALLRIYPYRTQWWINAWGKSAPLTRIKISFVLSSERLIVSESILSHTQSKCSSFRRENYDLVQINAPRRTPGKFLSCSTWRAISRCILIRKIEFSVFTQKTCWRMPAFWKRRTPKRRRRIGSRSGLIASRQDWN